MQSICAVSTCLGLALPCTAETKEEEEGNHSEEFVSFAAAEGWGGVGGTGLGVSTLTSPLLAPTTAAPTVTPVVGIAVPFFTSSTVQQESQGSIPWLEADTGMSGPPSSSAATSVSQEELPAEGSSEGGGQPEQQGQEQVQEQVQEQASAPSSPTSPALMLVAWGSGGPVAGGTPWAELLGDEEEEDSELPYDLEVRVG